jgi:uncharacterized protein
MVAVRHLTGLIGRCLWPSSCAVLSACVLSGCASASLDHARRNFYAGRFEQAGHNLSDARIPRKERALFLMERGTIRQSQGAYADSARDLIEAASLLEAAEAYSVTKDTATIVINDSVADFRGFPFERTLLHTFTAMDHLADGSWDNAAVEARQIIKSLAPEVRGQYPEDAYSRYVAGLCLELIGDRSNMSLQYREADKLLKTASVDPATGRLSSRLTNSIPPESTGGPAGTAAPAGDAELVCLVLSGGVSADMAFPPSPFGHVYGEIYVDGKYAGRSWTLADTADLSFTTEEMQAARKVAKTVARVAAKETIAHSIEKNDEFLGGLARLILIGLLEQPDLRRWETLPRGLGVARVPCPEHLTRFDVVFRASDGTVTSRMTVEKPLARRGSVWVSFCRDLAPVAAAPPTSKEK